MTQALKLEALESIGMSHGLSWAEVSDIGLWCRLSGPKYDVSVLSDKTLEHIDALYSKFFEV